ncbi:hypothetical protein FSAG_002359 [Fusobacterium periodonticum 2_1_31]|uniref:Uncharacterized protein n=1 Tax=Fusobacterium periodonticum 2_1_31 TaxID=469599 RepID=A0ABR4WN74_9FUSO|nr:hypothetical protein FSAG_002359 [Fusobacterium periodonticum 2_1_31]
MMKILLKFPSPYGVSFILMQLMNYLAGINELQSFRLLTEYHSFLSKELKKYIAEFMGFRLLTEYHSFLFYLVQLNNNLNKNILGFRLLTEYHSFL